MSTQNHARIAALAQQLRTEALGTTGPEMHVCVNSGVLLELLNAMDMPTRLQAEAERAGLSSAVGKLGALVDHLRVQLRKAADTMSALHRESSPVDGDIDARIPYDAFHVFVNEHAALLHELAHGPSAAPSIPIAPAAAPELSGSGAA